MKTYFFHLKGSNTPTAVKGASIKLEAGSLFTVRDTDGDVLAQFSISEVQGWRSEGQVDKVAKPVKLKRA